jgi:hypothetical protein
MKDELKGMWKEVVTTKVKVLSRYSRGGIGENQEIPKDSLRSSQYSNQAPTECESEALPLESTCSVSTYRIHCDDLRRVESQFSGYSIMILLTTRAWTSNNRKSYKNSDESHSYSKAKKLLALTWVKGSLKS